jgi:hypothetical protein
LVRRVSSLARGAWREPGEPGCEMLSDRLKELLGVTKRVRLAYKESCWGRLILKV